MISFVILATLGPIKAEPIPANNIIDIALGAKVFFYRLVKKLGDYTIASTLKEYQKEKEGNSEQISEENGKAIKQYLSLQKEMSEELMKLQHSPFTSV